MQKKNHIDVPRNGDISALGCWAANGYFVGDDVTADDIIGPEYLSFDLEQDDERRMLAGYAFAGLRERYGRFCEAGKYLSPFQIVVSGEQFGKGSGRAHSAIALQEAGIRMILAKSYGDAFYRSCVNNGSIIPLILVATEATDWGKEQTGMKVTIDVSTRVVQVWEGEGLVVSGEFEDPGVVLDIGVAGGLEGFLSGSATG